MQRATTQPAPNPLANLAGALPVSTLGGIDAAARLIGATLAILYAWDQYDTFDRYFGRTWTFTVVIAVVAIATTSVLAGHRGTWLRAFGAGMLFFGGAMLASEWTGMVMVVAGAIAWLTTAAIAYQRGVSPASYVGGLMVGSAATFVLVAAIVLTIEG